LVRQPRAERQPTGTIVDGGHFALDVAADPIAQYIWDFMKWQTGGAA